MTPDEVAEEVLANAPLKDSSSTYDFKTGGTSEKKAEEKADPKTRMEQVLADLESRSKPSAHFMNAPLGRYHIKDLFLVGQVGVMIGAWKSGKTFSALHLAFCVAWGRPLSQPKTEFGKPAKPVGEIRHSGNVLYIPSEGAGGLRDRIKAYRQYYKSLKTDAGDVIVYDKAVNVFEEASLNAVSAFCTKHRIVLIIIDTLASNLAGLALAGRSNPENDNALMSHMFDSIQHSVCEKQQHGCSALFLHHPSKGQDSTDARGGGGIEASARFKLAVTNKEGVRSFFLKAVEGETGFFSALS
jgi:RecA-family ATPase